MSQAPRPIVVVPRRQAEQLSPERGQGCISITNPRQSPAFLPDWPEVLRLGFHDTDRRGGNFTPMGLADAAKILDFAREYRHSPLLVHCEFGASRSAAVGLFLATWFRRPLSLTDAVLMPNPWVLRQLRLQALRKSLAWGDRRLLVVALQGPLSLRHEVLPAAICTTYLD